MAPNKRTLRTPIVELSVSESLLYCERYASSCACVETEREHQLMVSALMMAIEWAKKHDEAWTQRMRMAATAASQQKKESEEERRQSELERRMIQAATPVTIKV